METTIDEPVTKQILQRLSAVEIDVAVIKSNYATREDIARTHEAIAKLEGKVESKGAQNNSMIAQMEVRLIKWFVATAITLSGVSASLAFLAARFVH